jgi:hypothetical protein
MTVAFFEKQRSVRAASAFWENSPSSTGTGRAFQAHVPWSDAIVYFDTSGCCDADLTRISAGIDTFSGYTGDATWWQSWHHFAFVKDGTAKRIYIDGILFLEGSGDPLKSDFTSLVLGGGPGIADNRLDGLIDDFVVYSGALTEAQVMSLSGGTAPATITGLVAHWDFNDQVAAAVRLAAVRAATGNAITLTSEPAALPAGWVIQSADSASGPWTTMAGATTPLTVDIGAGNKFLRATKP